MTTIDQAAPTGGGRPAEDTGETLPARLGLALTHWGARWGPDSRGFVALAGAVVAAAALLNGAPAAGVAKSFGEGFWSLITFTMQMAMVVISGYVVATSPPAARLIDALAAMPRSGRSAVGFVAAVSMLASLLNWGMSLIFSGLLVRAMARRTDLRMDYRAAGAAGCLGLGATWALGLSSSAAQLQANAASLPKPLLDITGVIPFSQTIFLWQSMVIVAVLFVVSILLSLLSAPSGGKAVTAQMIGENLEAAHAELSPRQRPGEWLEYNPLLTLIVVALAGGWLAQEFAAKDPILAISHLHTYNLMFLMLGALLPLPARRLPHAGA